MKKILTAFFIFFGSLFLLPSVVSAQETQTYSRGEIQEIIEETAITTDQDTSYIQRLNVKLQSGENVKINFGSEQQPLESTQRLTVGQEVIIAEQQNGDGNIEQVIADKWRVPIIWWLSGIFLIVVIAVARQQGFSSILGMVASVGILLNFIVPQILQGANPFYITTIGVILIATLTIYLTHGWKLESHIALLSILVTIGLVALLSTVSVHVAHLSGLGNESAYFVQMSSETKLNLQGLLLGGILLGALGVLDDICVSQVSVVRQLLAAKKDIPFPELYQRAMSVGKDHVASLVNTLVLAYAGANLPLFLLFTLNKDVPLWVTLNQEMIIEEIIRTLSGSIGLVVAVPLTTLIASWFLYGKVKQEVKSSKVVFHRH